MEMLDLFKNTLLYYSKCMCGGTSPGFMHGLFNGIWMNLFNKAWVRQHI